MKLYFGVSIVIIILVALAVFWTSSPTYDDLMFFNAKKATTGGKATTPAKGGAPKVTPAKGGAPKVTPAKGGAPKVTPAKGGAPKVTPAKGGKVTTPKPKTTPKSSGSAAAIAKQEALIAQLRKDKSKKDELAAAIKKLKLLQAASTTGSGVATQTQIDAQKLKIKNLEQKLKDNPKSQKAKDDLAKATAQLNAMQATGASGAPAPIFDKAGLTKEINTLQESIQDLKKAAQGKKPDSPEVKALKNAQNSLKDLKAVETQQALVDNLKQKLKDNPKSQKAKDDLAKAQDKLQSMQTTLATGMDKDAKANIKALYDKADKLAKIAAKADPNTAKGRKEIQDAKDAAAAADKAAAAYASDRRRFYNFTAVDVGNGGLGLIPEPLVSAGKLTQKELKDAYLKPGVETYDGTTFVIKKDGTIESRPCFGTECDGNTIDAGSAMYLANAWLRSSGQLKPGEIFKVPTKDGKSTELYTVNAKGDVVPYKNNPKDTKPVTCPVESPTAPTTGHDPGELRFLAGGSGGDKACDRAGRPNEAANMMVRAADRVMGTLLRRGRTPSPGNSTSTITMSQLTSLPVTQQHAPAGPTQEGRVVVANREAAAARAEADRAARNSSSVGAAGVAIDAQAAADRAAALSQNANSEVNDRYQDLITASAAWTRAMNTGQPQSVIDAAFDRMSAAQTAHVAAKGTATAVAAAAADAADAAKKARNAAVSRPNTVNSDVFLDVIIAYSDIRTYRELQRVYGNNIVTREQYDTYVDSSRIHQSGNNDVIDMARYVMENPTRATASGFYRSRQGSTVSAAQQTLFDTVQATYGNLNQHLGLYRTFEQRHPENSRAGIAPDVFALVSEFPRGDAKNRKQVWTALQNYYAGTTFLRDNNITYNNFNAIREVQSPNQLTLTLTDPPPERPSGGPTLNIGRLNGDRYSESALLRSIRAFRNAGGTYQQYVQAATDMGLTTENGGLASESLYNGRIQR